MIQTLIVDDLNAELDVILYLIQKHELPLNTATASNGEEALEYMKNHYVELLITDIRMPFIDGLALSEDALKLNPELKIIISSGYTDFTYAKTAISLGVVEYLLKPIRPAEFVQIITHVVSQLNEDRQKKEMRSLQLSYSRDQITLQLINGNLLPERNGLLPDKIRSLMPTMGYYFLISTDESHVSALSFLRSDIKELGSQIFRQSVRCLQPSSELLLLIVDFLSGKAPVSNDMFTSEVEKLTSLVMDLYQVPLRILTSCVPAPEAIHDTYIHLKQQLLSTCSKRKIATSASTPEERDLDSISSKVRFIRNYIASHYREELNLEILAGVAYIHPDYLSRIFKKETGMNLNHYIKTYRLNQSCRLLETTQQKITSISIAVGYQNCAYFIRSFAEHYGVTPEKYRQQHTINE
jgi:Response regulator containing CheY-like receiver domain and AraC-type DNA-binding domain